MMRALFVREENDHLVIGSGVPAAWFENSERFSYGPTATAWGPVSIIFSRRDGHWFAKIDGAWAGQPPRARIEAPGFEPVWAQSSRWETPLLPKT